MKKSLGALLFFVSLFAFTPSVNADDRLTRIRQREAQLILCDEAYYSAVATATYGYDRALTNAHDYFEQDLYSTYRNDDFEFSHRFVDVYDKRTQDRDYYHDLRSAHSNRRNSVDIARDSRKEKLRLGRLEYEACVRGE